jgi:ABC-type uncharacterized transport system substrate-binding protein
MANRPQLQIDERWTAGDPERNRRFAAELMAMHPDAVFAFSSVAVEALQRESSSVPIVFTAISDPVGSGFVQSLPRPGGNATGFTNFVPTMAAKWLEVLKEIAPQVQHVALLFNPQTAPYVAEYYQRPFEEGAPAFGVRASAVVVHEMPEIEAAMAALAREPGGGLVVPPDNFSYVNRTMIFALAARHMLPAVYPFRFMAREGGLVSYGVDLSETFPRAAEYVDRILGGTKPADLPVQAPTKFELAINLKAASAFSRRRRALASTRRANSRVGRHRLRDQWLPRGSCCAHGARQRAAAVTRGRWHQIKVHPDS